jgi:hypothetical protein
MSRRTEPWLLPVILLTATLALAHPTTDAATDAAVANTAASALAAAQDAHQRAELHYWFALHEHGDMPAFRRALAAVAEARAHLARTPETPATVRLRTELATLATDLELQMDMAHDTFQGVFPLARFLGRTLFLDAGAAGAYEFVDEPDVIAVSRAAEEMVQDILLQYRNLPQYPAVFTSRPPDDALENEVRYIFQRQTRVTVRPQAAVAAALDPAQWDRFQTGTVDSATAATLMDAFGLDRLLVVSINQLGPFGDDHFVRLDASLHAAGQAGPELVLSRRAVCHDRRAAFPAILLANAAFLVLAVLLFAALVRLRTFRWPAWPVLLTAPVVGFVVGRVAPWFVFSATSTLRPEPETLAKLSFWWPVLAGMAVVCGPTLMYRIVSHRLAALAPALAMRQRGAAMAVAIGLGACAYLAAPLLIYPEAQGWLLLVATVACVVLLNVLLGRTLDAEDSSDTRLIGIPLLLSALLGPALLTARLDLVAACLGLTAIPIAVLWQREQRGRQAGQDHLAGGTPTAAAVPATASELAARCDHPPFIRTAAYDRAEATARASLQNGGGQIALIGDRGVGKTAALEALCRELASHQAGVTRILRGTCPNPGEDGIAPAYAPFQQAISAEFGINLMGDADSQLELLDAGLEELLGTVVPLAGVLFPAAESRPASGSREEIHRCVAAALAALAHKAPVVVVLDDIQWVDPSSGELLAHLLDRKPTGVTWILAGHAPRSAPITAGPVHDAAEVLADAGFAGTRITLDSLDQAEKQHLLTGALGLAPDTAGRICTQLARMGSFAAHGELHWLLEVVRGLAEQGALERTGRGWALTAPDTGNLPVPDGMRLAVREKLAGLGADRILIECAACVGLRFRASTLADIVQRPRLALLERLHAMEQQTGLIEDVREEDDIFRFRSSFLLDVARAELRIGDQGPGDRDTPQIVREYHAQVAQALERSMGEGSSLIFEVANHYYAAGRGHVDHAVASSLAAARAATRVFAHQDAERYLERARECAELEGTLARRAGEFLAAEMHAAHVRNEGPRTLAVAEAVATHLGRHLTAAASTPSPRFLLASARTFYDAIRHAHDGDRARWSTLCQRTAEHVLTRPDLDRLTHAEALQFTGLALPLDRRADRVAPQLAALVALGDPDPDPGDAAGLALYARILNSLAEDYSQMPEVSWQDAEAAYCDSLTIKCRPATLDLPGQARCWGGLGRLHLFRRGNHARARDCFRRDLALAEATGDVDGQVMMHSLVGQCDLALGHLDAAAAAYRRSLALATGPVPRTFALTGLLAVAGRTAELIVVDRAGQDLLAGLDDGTVPAPCRGHVAAVLAEVAGQQPTPDAWPWLAALQALAMARDGDTSDSGGAGGTP